MNKKSIIIITLITTISLLIVGAITLLFLYFSSTNLLQKTAVDVHTRYLNNIIYNYKNDLVSGNYRTFRSQVSMLMDKGVFSDYAILRNGIVEDSSDTYGLNKNNSNIYKIIVPVWFDENNTLLWGEVILLIDDKTQTDFSSLILGRIGKTLIIGFTFFWAMTFVYLYFWQKLNFALSEGLNDIFTKNIKKKSVGFFSSIWLPVLDQAERLKNDHDFLSEKVKENQRNELIIEITKQVSHDIRSPLAALKMSLEEIDNIPLKQRSMIKTSVQRINDIANNLLNSGTKNSLNSKIKIEFLGSLVDSLVSEKRMQYRNKLNINIESEIYESYGLFARINSVELKRVLSNLINNSVEAIISSGNIIVKISESSDGRILLSISDNGKGMPDHVLKKLGEKGFSFDKKIQESGSGLGFSHAQETLESFGGNLEVESNLEKGTLIKIFLNKATPPKWYVDYLDLSHFNKILIIDDDESILQAWRQRLPSNTLCFKDGEEFSQTVKVLPSQNFLALVDYELHGQSHTGLEIIKLLQIEKQSILVTSRFEEQEILRECEALGIRLIPKTMISLVPIKNKIHEAVNFFEYVYIDDEKIMRMAWEKRAKKKNLSLLTLTSTKEFEKYSDKIDKELTSIYLDSNLGEGEIKGEDFAQILHDNGYKKLFISSGYEKDNFSHLSWLIYTEKVCPF